MKSGKIFLDTFKEFKNPEEIKEVRIDVKYKLINSDLSSQLVPMDMANIFNGRTNIEAFVISNVSSDMLHDVMDTIQDDFPGSGVGNSSTINDLIKVANAKDMGGEPIIREDSDILFMMMGIAMNNSDKLDYTTEFYPFTGVRIEGNVLFLESNVAEYEAEEGSSQEAK